MVIRQHTRRHIFGEINGVLKGLWALFLDCAFGMLID